MKKVIAFILTIVIAMQYPLTSYATTLDENDNNINCKSAVLICADTGDILFEKNAYEHLSPASITKILALLIVLENIENGVISLNDKVCASENAVAMGGSQIWLELGEEMTVDELLKAVIIASANDAITALGEYISGSSAAFVKAMNDKAKELNLENTNFENCTGLDDTITNHYSCAYDLAIIAKEVMKYELVTKYSTIWLDSLRNGKTELNNTNKLVKTYNGITGLKTGTTSNAGFCLCATASRDGMNLISVVLGAPTSKDRFESSTYLLDWVFANFELVEPNIDLSQISKVKIENGLEKSTTPIPFNNDKVLVEKGNNEFTFDYQIDESVQAPLLEGQKLGQIIIKNNEKQIGHIDLVSAKQVDKITFMYILLILFKNI